MRDEHRRFARRAVPWVLAGALTAFPAYLLGGVAASLVVILLLGLAKIVLIWHRTNAIERLASEGMRHGVEMHLRADDFDVHVGAGPEQ